MANKRRTKNDMLMLAQALVNCNGNEMPNEMPYGTAMALFGTKLLKKARQREIIIMDPDPHDGRTSKSVGEHVRQILPGGKWKKGVATNIRYGTNVVPRRVVLTAAGRQMLAEEKKGV